MYKELLAQLSESIKEALPLEKALETINVIETVGYSFEEALDYIENNHSLYLNKITLTIK